jgi:chemotaxis methyl-accepting protein methylase
MLDCICTNETHFFREPRQFEFLESVVFPEWRERAESGRMSRRVRVWSAGCSTGEEPYSVAMAFLAAFPPGSGWEIDIVATDLSTRVLERAQAAVWPIDKAKEIPGAYLKAFMLRGTGPEDGRMKAGSILRSRVRFLRVNLNAEPFTFAGRFDLVLCRNVLIYFDAPSKARVLSRLLERLDPHGYLFLGHAETVTGSTLPRAAWDPPSTRTRSRASRERPRHRSPPLRGGADGDLRPRRATARRAGPGRDVARGGADGGATGHRGGEPGSRPRHRAPPGGAPRRPGPPPRAAPHPPRERGPRR